MDDLQIEYDQARQPVLFVEQNAYDSQGNRIDRFFNAYQGTSAPVPNVMVDSGYRISYGSQSDYHVEYRKIVNEALLRPAQAAITATYTVHNSIVDVTADVTNLSEQVLSPENYATFNVLVVEHAHVVHTDRFVRSAGDIDIRPALPVGATGRYQLHLEAVPVESWERAFVVVMVDYEPDVGSVRYDMLQAAIAARTGLPYAIDLPLTMAPGAAAPLAR